MTERFAMLLVLALFLATLTLWISAYWPVAAFEISVFVFAGMAILLLKKPESGTWFPLFALSFIVAWGCLQLITGSTTNRFVTERATVQWMSWAAMYYCGISLFREETLSQLIRLSIIWFSFALAVEAILQKYVSPGMVFGLFPTGYHDFVMGPIVYHTHFAAFIETVLPLALFHSLSRTRILYLYLAISAVLVTAVLVSASRGGLIITCLEGVCVLILLRRRERGTSRRMIWVASILLAATAALAIIVGIKTVSDRFSSETFFQGRLQFALSTLHMIAARPLAGWGLGCWPTVYPAFATFDPGVIVNQAHTDWLQWTAEGGLPVGIAMLAMVLWGIRPAFRSIWGIGAIAVFIHAGFDYPFSRPVVGAWPIFILAMTVARKANRRSLRSDGDSEFIGPALNEEKTMGGPFKPSVGLSGVVCTAAPE